jgi:hypothetical protein
MIGKISRNAQEEFSVHRFVDSWIRGFVELFLGFLWVRSTSLHFSPLRFAALETEVWITKNFLFANSFQLSMFLDSRRFPSSSHQLPLLHWKRRPSTAFNGLWKAVFARFASHLARNCYKIEEKKTTLDLKHNCHNIHHPTPA